MKNPSKKIQQNKANKKIKTIMHDEGIFRAGIIFLIFSGFTSILNYLYHLFMGRMLGPEEYGILGSLFAIIYLVDFSTGTFNLVISKHVAEFHGKKQKEKIKSLFSKAFKVIMVYGLAGFLMFLAISPLIKNFMNLQSYSGLIIVGLIACFSFISVLFTGTLNGLQKFVWQNSSSTVSKALKFTLAIILVFIGFSINGALTAILIGIIISLFIAYIPIKKEFKDVKPKDFNAKSIYLYAIPVFFATMFSVLVITFDQILVKHYFSSADAGIYAAAGMIGKMIWFGSSALVGPLFPKIVNLKSKGKDTSKMLIKALAYTATLATLGSIVFAIAPTFIMNISYGSQYSAAVPLVLMFGIAMGLFSLIQVLMVYNLGIGNYKFIYVFAAAVILEIIGIVMFHSNLQEVVKILLITNIFIVINMLILNRDDLLNHIK
ncbi:MAG: oligosaccharide flippase family protein [Nanoarchaeota archaeon]